MRAAAGWHESAPRADLMWPRSRWPTRMREYCGRCSAEVIVTARAGYPRAQFCTPALHPRETVDFLWLGLLRCRAIDLIVGVEREVRRLEGMGQLGFGFECAASARGTEAVE